MIKLDERELRRAFGCFPTGVMVALTCDAEVVSGITINSFSSVSLDPPIVSWAISKKSSKFDFFTSGDHHTLCVLSREQADLVDFFSSKENTISDLGDNQIGIHQSGMPGLEHVSATFYCKKHDYLDVGDHRVFFLKVIDFYCNQAESLLFYKGKINTKMP